MTKAMGASRVTKIGHGEQRQLEKGEEGLPLRGHEVEPLQGLRRPDDRRQHQQACRKQASGCAAPYTNRSAASTIHTRQDPVRHERRKWRRTVHRHAMARTRNDPRQDRSDHGYTNRRRGRSFAVPISAISRAACPRRRTVRGGAHAPAHGCVGQANPVPAQEATAERTAIVSVPTIQFRPVELPNSGTLVVFAAEGMALGEACAAADAASDGLISAAAEAQSYKGKRFATMTLPLPRGLSARAVLVVGLGDSAKLDEADWVKLGGTLAGALPSGPDTDVTVFAEVPNGTLWPSRSPTSRSASCFAGTRSTITSPEVRRERATPRRAWSPSPFRPDAAEIRWWRRDAIAGGHHARARSRQRACQRARPGGVRRTRRAAAELGVDITVMEPAELEGSRCDAAGVAQGSERPARVVRDGVEGRRRTRSPSRWWARASCSTPAASPSSRPAAWRT